MKRLENKKTSKMKNNSEYELARRFEKQRKDRQNGNKGNNFKKLKQRKIESNITIIWEHRSEEAVDEKSMPNGIRK